METLKARLSAFSTKEDVDFDDEHSPSGHIYSTLDLSPVNDNPGLSEYLRMEKDCFQCHLELQMDPNEQNYESLSSSDMEDSVTDLSKNVEICSRVPKKPENEKATSAINMNSSNNVSDHSYDIFEELASAINRLDNQSAKGKAELRKSGPMAHRKPPTKSVGFMI